MQKPLAQDLAETYGAASGIRWRDLVTLAKPRITLMVVITAVCSLDNNPWSKPVWRQKSTCLSPSSCSRRVMNCANGVVD